MPRKHTAADRTDRAAAPIQSKASTAAGFKRGLNNMIKKGVEEIPGANKAHAASWVRSGVFHPGAEKP